MALNLIVPDFGDVTDPETIQQIFDDLTLLRSDVDTLLSKVTRRVRLTGDHALNTSSTALQNITGLTLSVEANSNYEGLVVAAWTLATGTAEDIRFGFTWPASSTFDFGAIGPSTAGLGAGTAVASDVEFIQRLAATSGVTVVSFGASTAVAGGLIPFQITTGGTAGNVQLQAAQNTSGGNVVTVKAGTRLMMWKAG